MSLSKVAPLRSTKLLAKNAKTSSLGQSHKVPVYVESPTDTELIKEVAFLSCRFAIVTGIWGRLKAGTSLAQGQERL